jgi:hypothetical protein
VSIRLTRDAILAAATLPTESVELKSLDGSVLVRGLSAFDRDAFEKSMFVTKGKTREFNMANVRARLVALCAVDDNGGRLFADEDVVALGQVRADVVDKLFTVAQRLSGLRDEDVAELGSPSA